MAAPLHVELRRHVERGGYHADRFDAYLAGQLICTSRQPWHDCARKLIELGDPPDYLLIVQHHGCAFDPTIKPRSIGELAKWTYEESDRDGIRKVRWRPPEERSGVAQRSGWASPAGADAAGGTTGRPTLLGPLPTLFLGAQQC